MVSQETGKRRFVSFYLEDVGGHQALEVNGSLEVKDFSGNKLGTFPREQGERYSWYLCGCGRDPFAWRARGPTDFKCLVCRQPPQALFVCSCGVVSPVGDEPRCLWCGRTPVGQSHVCRETGGLVVFQETANCPLCGKGSDPPMLEAIPVAKKRPSPISEAVRKTQPLPPSAKTPLSQSVSGDAPSEASPKIEPLTTVPFPILTVPAGTRTLPSGVFKPIAPAAVFILVLLAASSWLFHLRSPDTRIRAAIQRGDLLSSSGNSAVEIFETLYVKDPTSGEVRELGSEISEALRPEAEEALNRFYSESADIDWHRLSRIYEFLVKVFPDNREILARRAYCEAQIALDEGNYQLARDGYKAAHEQQPNWALALNGLGKIYARADSPFKDFKIAKDFYIEAHRADPRFIFPLLNLAQLSILENSLNEAEGYLRRAISINSERPGAFRELGRVLRLQRRFREAVEAYKKCLLYETDPEVRIRVQTAVSELEAKL